MWSKEHMDIGVYNGDHWHFAKKNFKYHWKVTQAFLSSSFFAANCKMDQTTKTYESIEYLCDEVSTAKKRYETITSYVKLNVCKSSSSFSGELRCGNNNINSIDQFCLAIVHSPLRCVMWNCITQGKKKLTHTKYTLALLRTYWLCWKTPWVITNFHKRYVFSNQTHNSFHQFVCRVS